MSLGNLVIGANTYIDAGTGRYINTNQTLGGLRDEIKIAKGTEAKKANPPTVNCTFSRFQEKTITINGVPTTKRGVVTVSFSVEKGFAIADLDTLLSDLNTVITASNLNLVLNGAN